MLLHLASRLGFENRFMSMGQMENVRQHGLLRGCSFVVIEMF